METVNKNTIVPVVSSVLATILIAITVIVLRAYAGLDLALIFTVAGTVITGLAFVIGAYFAVLAVSAYAHYKDIELQRKAADELVAVISAKDQSISSTYSTCLNTAEIISNSARQSLEQADSLFLFANDMLIGLIPQLDENFRPKAAKMSEKIRSARACFILSHPFASLEEKISQILNLATVTDHASYETLKKIVDDDKENEQVKGYARRVLKSITDHSTPPNPLARNGAPA